MVEAAARQQPWQLQAFDRTLKKRIKAGLIKQRLGDLNGASCMLVSCGENNGAINYHLRDLGGSWVWAEFESVSIPEIQALLGQPVLGLNKENPHIPLEVESLDLVVALDAHEHLEDPQTFTQSIARTLKPGGKVLVSVPNGSQRMAVARLKRLVRMPESLYGHLVPGYDIEEMNHMLSSAGLRPSFARYYSKFFTESLELLLNVAYVKGFSKLGAAGKEPDTVAPTTEGQMKKIEGGFKAYRYVYPLFRLISSLDRLLPRAKGYAVLVEAVKDK